MSQFWDGQYCATLVDSGEWTKSLAVGSLGFIEEMEGKVRNRQETQRFEEGDTWILNETYGSFLDLKKRPIPPTEKLDSP